MKTVLLMTLLTIGQIVLADDCYMYDAAYNQSTITTCESINMNEAIDEGYVVFDDVSTDYLDGCLIRADRSDSLIREYDSRVCEESLDEGWIVLGSAFYRGRYSDSEKYVVCDIPLSEYADYKENGYFTNQSLEEEGFLHCAKPSQLEYVMNNYFKEDTYVLFISTRNLLGSDLKYEGTDQSNLYPHLYRVFNKTDSITEIIVSSREDGKFVLPAELDAKNM